MSASIGMWLFWMFMIVFAFLVLRGVAMRLDRSMGKRTQDVLTVVDKWVVPTGSYDPLLDPIEVYYARIVQGKKKLVVKITQDDWDKVVPGRSYNFDLIIGWSGVIYPVGLV